jgi:AcrR family transcriptional regulator
MAMAQPPQNKSAPNRTARRRLRTRQQLLEAVESLVLSSGYADTSAEAIAELADLGRSTFYNHFNNKQEAVLATITARFADYGAKANVPEEQSPDRAVALTISATEVFLAVARDPFTKELVDRPRLLIQALIDSQYDFIVAELAGGIDQGRFKFVTSLEQTITLLLWGKVGLLTSAINNGSMETVCRDWCRLLLLNVGIAPDEIESIINTALPPAPQ